MENQEKGNSDNFSISSSNHKEQGQKQHGRPSTQKRDWSKYNQKKKLKNTGSYIGSLLEKAKNALSAPNFDAEAVIGQKEFQGLSELEKKTLRESARKKRDYLKKNPEKAQRASSNMAEEKKVSSQPFGGKIPTPTQRLQTFADSYTERLNNAETYEQQLLLIQEWSRTENLSLCTHLLSLSLIPLSCP